MKRFAVVLACVVCAILLMNAGCCKRCCSPSVEVGIIRPGEPCKDKIQMWTWNPVSLYPRNPEVNVSNQNLKPRHPYLPKVHVTNFSDVPVRGVEVVFYWNSFGLFDRGTPIGAVAVDLKENQSRWVSGPATITLDERRSYSLCLAARIFHPCDTDLRNNICWRNFKFMNIPFPWRVFVVPFLLDFEVETGNFRFAVQPSDRRVSARIVPKPLREGEWREEPEIQSVEGFDIKGMEAREYSLVLQSMGDFNAGDEFEVTVSAEKDGEIVSSFTLVCKVGG